MPNVNEFITYCSNLGIDHIEVLDDATYESLYHKTGVLSEQYEVVRNMTVINTTTYENYQRRLDKENIVFFVRGKVKTSGVNFKGKYIGEIIQEIENRTQAEATAEDEEYWGAEGVEQFLSDLIGGNLILKEDENGTVTLPLSVDTMYIGNAFVYKSGADAGVPAWAYESVDTTDLSIDCGIRTFNGAYNDEIVAQGLLGIKANNFDSFLDKVQQKARVAMGDSDTLTNIALPWLYTKFGIYPTKVKLYSSQVAGVYGALVPSVDTLQFAVYKRPDPAPPITRSQFSDVWELVLSNFGNDYIEYKIKFEEYNKGKLDKDNFGIQDSWSMNAFLNQYSNNVSADTYSAVAYSAWTQSNDFSAIYLGIPSAGGYDLNLDYCGSSVSTERVQKYTVQPFMIGMVFWITDIKKELDNQYALCWAIPIGFDESGNLMMPYKEGNRNTVQEISDKHNIYQFPIDFKGHIALPLALNMTNAEFEYATERKNLIVPVTCLPNDYMSL